MLDNVYLYARIDFEFLRDNSAEKSNRKWYVTILKGKRLDGRRQKNKWKKKEEMNIEKNRRKEKRERKKIKTLHWEKSSRYN